MESAKNEEEGNFIISRSIDGTIGKLKLEVGGASMKTRRSDFVIRDDLDFPGGNALPLWLLGMAY